VIGVNVTFQYDDDFDRGRVAAVAENARSAFEGLPGLRSKVFTIDDTNHRAMNFYVWDSEDAATSFFSDQLRERVTGLYGVAPTIDFVEIAQIVDNSGT
jgi:heme-degrading monooxygenase HmoA